MNNDYCVYCMEPSSKGICTHCGKDQSDYHPAPHHLAPGTVLNNRYIVGAILGEGGFGITYIGRDMNLDMRVAIKEYYPSGMVNRNNTVSEDISVNVGSAGDAFEKGKTSFLAEARALAKFSDDSHTVSVRDFFSENNTAYIVMEYLEGITLKDYLDENGPLSFGQAFEILSPIMDSLTKIHATGIIHRDISPANIVIRKDGNVKLLDFGAARNVKGTDEKSLSILLKPGYAPEEQYRTKGDQGPWTDVYALSATMYKMVTGTTPDDAMNRLFSDDVLPPSSINPALSSEQDAVILKGMAIQKENRYQTVEALRAACADSLCTVPVTRPAVDDPEATLTGEQYFASSKNDPNLQKPADPVPAPPAFEQKPPAHKAAVQPAPVSATGEKAPATMPVKEQADRNGKSSEKELPSKSEGKPPKKIFLILAAAACFLCFYESVAFVSSIASNDTKSSVNISLGIIALIFGAITIVFGRAYFSKLDNKGAKPNRFCLAGSIAFLFAALFGAFMSYLCFTQGTAEEGVAEGWAAITVWMLVFSAFLGYFYYPRLERKKRVRATRIYGAALAAGLAAFIGFIVYQNLSVVTIGDQKIERSATEVTLNAEIIANIDMAKLSELKKLENLTIRACFLDDEDVRTIGELTQLKELSLLGNTDITDVSPLNSLKNLESLSLTATQTGDIGCLSDLTELKTLRINGTNVSDLSALDAFSSLETLEMASLAKLDASTLKSIPASVRSLDCSNDDLSDLAFVSGSESLRYIYASGNHIKDLSPLEKFDDLSIVEIAENEITDIGPISKNGLTKLDASGNAIDNITTLDGKSELNDLNLSNNKIKDISALGECYNLLTLDLSHNEIEDISALQDCFRISSLDLSYNTITDISAISTIDELSTLNLRSNKIVDISPLGENQNYTEKAKVLDLSDNQIENIEVLSSFGNVTDMELVNNRITDITPLAGCTALEDLDLSNNNVPDITALMGLTNLNTLSIVNDPITELSSLNLNPDAGRVNLGMAFLNISYSDDVDWEMLASKERLFVNIYGASERQKEALKEIGFTLANTRFRDEYVEETDSGETENTESKAGEDNG